jgi:membrane protease YdiL (CAAX protease family)
MTSASVAGFTSVRPRIDAAPPAGGGERRRTHGRHAESAMTTPNTTPEPPEVREAPAHTRRLDDAAPRFDRVRVRWLPLWLLGALVPLALFTRPDGGRTRDPGQDLVGSYAAVGVITLWAAWQCRRAGTSLRRLAGPAPSRWAGWRLARLTVALLLLSLGAFWLLWLPLSFVAPGVVRAWALDDHLPRVWTAGAPLRSTLAFLLLVVVGPAVEELLFRGVMLHRWAHKWGVGRALLVSSVVFGLGHADVLGAAAFGFVLGLLYIRTGSLWAPAACHMLNNALAVCGDLLPWGPSWGLPEAHTLSRFQHEWYVGAAALVAALPALYALRHEFLPATRWQLPALRVPDAEARPARGSAAA